MNSLNAIQTMAKVAKVLSNVIFVFAIVGLCLCVGGAIGFAFGFDGFDLGSVHVNGLVSAQDGLSRGAALAGLIKGILYCIGSIVLARFSQRYFSAELEAGTPFTADGAKQLQQLGILTAVLSAATQIVLAIVYAVLEKLYPGEVFAEIDLGVALTIGLAMIVISQICKYGSQLNQPVKDIEDTPDNG